MRRAWFQPRQGKRDGQRGADAVEFAISLFVLFPLMAGMLNYTYHLYIGLNVVEAERTGLVAAARTSGVGACTTTGGATSAASTAVSNYFTSVGLGSVVTVATLSGQPNPSSTPTCAIAPVSPTWSMTLAVDYKPLIGRVMVWDKASPVSGKLRYTASPLAMRGSP